jgi:hypothetical protein
VKKVIIYLFLAFLLFNYSSVMFALKLWQLEAKYEMSHKLKSQQKTERLTFHKNLFKERLQRGSEFDWENRRYDVVSASYLADSVFVEAINDTREKGILHFIGKFMHQHQKGNKDASKISNLCLLIFQAPLPEEIAFSIPVKEHLSYYYFELQRINKVYHQIQAPPPKLV